jgi:hypothetical protein
MPVHSLYELALLVTAWKLWDVAGAGGSSARWRLTLPHEPGPLRTSFPRRFGLKSWAISLRHKGATPGVGQI